MNQHERRRSMPVAAVGARFALRRMLTAASTAAKPRAGSAVGDLTNQFDQGLNFFLIDIFRRGNNFAVFKNPLVKQIWEMLVILLIPMAIRFVLLGDWSSLWDRAGAFFESGFWQKSCTRVIEYTEGGNTRMRFNPLLEDQQSMVENTDRNNLLQKAIRLYMSEKYDLNTPEMEANLTPAKKVSMEAKDDGIYGRRATFSGSYAQLVAFAVQLMPKKGQWMLVDKERQIWFMQNVNELQQGGEQNPVLQTKTTFYIKGTGPDAGSAVNAWINAAYDYYKENKRSQQDTSRFFYVAVPPEGKEKEKPKHFFKQYLLSDHKTFNSLFFPDKEPLLKLIDQFTKKEGKFAIEGFPDKLGLLLDGPPGTGKTSLIKALAHYLNRHVVSVNLARIKTNQELMDLLFDLIFPVQGGDLPMKLQYQDIVFVMEDVDAASRVVYARGGGKKASKKTKKKNVVDAGGVVGSSKDQHPGIIEAVGSESVCMAEKTGHASTAVAETGNTEDASSSTEVNDGKVEDVSSPTAKSRPPPMPTLLRMISGKESLKGEQDTAEVKELDAGKEVDESEEEEEDGDESTKAKSKNAETMVGELICRIMGAGDDSSGAEDGGKKGGSKTSFVGPWSKSSMFDGDDDLNLAGLLNVLDGVVDSPGRVVVMTTNHPDRLDPALIRPGRINKRIHLGYVNASSLCKMVEHYMQAPLTSKECELLTALSQRISVAPAQVEQCCAESDNVEDLIRMLADLS